VIPSLSGVFAPWLGERILENSGDLLVVDKPSGLSVHGAGLPDHDVVSRLARVLEARGDSTYLGVHQRLDLGTSGVLAFVKNAELNPRVAWDFENGRVEKRYVAAVELRDRSPLILQRELLLEHRLEVSGDSVRVVARGGKPSRAVCRVLERRDRRALLELQPSTGRTHQLRVQLAAVGAPIAGDRTYEGPAAPRLLLHAHALSLPALERRFEARVPRLFARYLDGTTDALGDRAEIRSRLLDAGCLRFPVAQSSEAFRWVNTSADELSGVVVDVYGGHVSLAVDSDEAEARAQEIAELLAELGALSVYLKRRVRKDLRRVERESLAPPAPLLGREATELVVDEGGLKTKIELGDGLSTGLFVDQRENRRRVRELARGGEVLNLFSYTCSFSVAAALGGAAKVTSVDTSARALARGVENFRINGLEPERHGFVREDALLFLQRAARRGARFDLVVLDPPSFSTRGGAKAWSFARDYAELARAALAVVKSNGSLLAVTNHRKTRTLTLRRLLVESAEKLGRAVKRAKILPAALDCPDGVNGPEPSKSVLITLG
jgi:23S rRNA (cytosine1962-C5)-methyltransferase